MSYERSEKPDNRVQINFYSNPRVKIENQPTGTVEYADAARRISEVRFAIAADGDESKQCSTSPTLTEGVVSSPNFPGAYPNNYDKTIPIQVDEGLVLILQIEAFDIEFEV